MYEVRGTKYDVINGKIVFWTQNSSMSYATENEIVRHSLIKIGLVINDTYDLVNTKIPYPNAIPIIINLLESPHINDPVLVEGLIRSLAVKEAKGMANDIVFKKFFEANDDSLILWAIGNTINVIATAGDLDRLLVLVKGKKYGTARQMPTMALGRFKSPIVEDVLISLLDDTDVLPHAIYALGKLKSIKAKVKLETFLNHPNSFIRREAKSALKKIQ